VRSSSCALPAVFAIRRARLCVCKSALLLPLTLQRAHIRRFHELAEFDGTRRSCRMRLQRHNARRRKKAAERPSSKKMAPGKGRLVAAGFQHQAPALSVPKQVHRVVLHQL